MERCFGRAGGRGYWEPIAWTSHRPVSTVVRYLSPLRYPGGKARLGPLLDRVIRSSGLVGCSYVEPYAGGAGAALSLLHRDTVSSIHINDASPAIAAFWTSIVEMNAEFCDRVADVTLDVEEWRRQKSVHDQQTEASTFDLGFAAFYLNRTNRSGIVGSGGVIGGQGQKGKWRMDARFGRDKLIERIQWIERHKDRIQVSGQDALDLLLVVKRSEDCFLYLDPPYYGRAERLYDQWYGHADHVKVCRAITDTTHPWVVSYNDCSEIRTLYRRLPSHKLNLRYSAARNYVGAEVVFYSNDLDATAFQMT